MGGRGSGNYSTAFDPLLVAEILATVATGRTLSAVLEQKGVPKPTFYGWLAARPELKSKLREARESCVDFLVDEAIGIADSDPDPQRARNRIQVRQWLASVIKPREYSERLALDVTHAVADPAVLHRDALARLRSMRPDPQLVEHVVNGEAVLMPEVQQPSAAELLLNTAAKTVRDRIRAKKKKADDEDSDDNEPFSIFD